MRNAVSTRCDDSRPSRTWQAPKMSPNRPRGQISRRFPEPSAKRPPWLKSRVPFGLGIWGGCAGIPALICLNRGGLEAPQHGTHCPQAPWPEEQRWLKRKRLSAHPKKSCRLNCVVTRSALPRTNAPSDTALRPRTHARDLSRCFRSTPFGASGKILYTV